MNGKTSKNPNGLYVGQELLLIINNVRKDRSELKVKITKVGIKWAAISGYFPDSRIDIRTLQVDGGNYSSPGQCYVDEQSYRKEQSIKNKWWKCREYFSPYSVIPTHITESDLDSILSILSANKKGDENV